MKSGDPGWQCLQDDMVLTDNKGVQVMIETTRWTMEINASETTKEPSCGEPGEPSLEYLDLTQIARKVWMAKLQRTGRMESDQKHLGFDGDWRTLEKSQGLDNESQEPVLPVG